jgi:hypothetical protein
MIDGGRGMCAARMKGNMEWLTVALREPLVEVLNLVVLSVLAVVTQRLRARQSRAHDQLRADGALPPRGQSGS